MADTYAPTQLNRAVVAGGISADFRTGGLNIGVQGRVLMSNNGPNDCWFTLGTAQTPPVIPPAADGDGQTRLRNGMGFALEVTELTWIAFNSVLPASVDIIVTRNPGIGPGSATT